MPWPGGRCMGRGRVVGTPLPSGGTSYPCLWCPNTSPLCPPKVLHSVCRVPACGCHHVCVLVCQPWDVCVHTHTCICPASPSFGSGCYFWLSALSPVTSVPQPERGDTLGSLLHLGYRARARLTVGAVSLPLGFYIFGF